MPVEVVLKSKIASLGSEADIVSVKPGYARNFLVPQGHAVMATSATKRQIEVLRRKRADREAEEYNAAQETAARLNKLKLTFILAAVEGQEKVFGSITNQAIADRLKNEGYHIDRKKIKLDRPIKDLGEHEVPLDIHPDVQVKIKVVIAPPASEKSKEEAGDKADGGKATRKPRPAKK